MKVKSFFLTSGLLLAFLAVNSQRGYAQLSSLLPNDHSSKAQLIKVKKVINADTLILEDDKRIKLIGLEAPKTPKPKTPKTDEHNIIIEEINPITTIEEQALDFARHLSEDEYVRLEFDAESKDRNLETLAYVFLEDGTFVNAEILRQGFANLKIIPPNTKYAKLLRQAYQEAHREKRGLQGE